MTKRQRSGADVTESGIKAPSTARPMRADARRNVDLLVAAAREAFAAHGPEASLDDIARSAGVGSGTLYRHFPTRLALLEAVYRDNVQRLAAEGDRLRATLPPGEALVAWLGEFVGYVAIKRGLATALTRGLGNVADIFAQSHAVMARTGDALLADAKDAGAIREDVELMDLLRLAGAIGAAAENSPEGPALSERLLRLAVDGVRPSAGTR
jgi:AcrR family transcriptional regulator